MLDSLLLCVEKKADAALRGKGADFIDGIGEGLWWR